MNTSDWIALSSAAASFITIGIEHIWTRNKLEKSEARQNYREQVEEPLRILIENIGDVIVDIDDWSYERGTKSFNQIRSDWNRLARRINSRVNTISRDAQPSQKKKWLTIDTEEADNIFSASEEAHRVTTCRNVKQDLERLIDDIKTAIQDNRYKQ